MAVDETTSSGIEEQLDNVALDDNGTGSPSTSQVNEEGIPYVNIQGQMYPPLADGHYDAIIMSTGLEECILAGLLAVRGKKVLQLDRNDFYGGSCASLNLRELYTKAGKEFGEEVERKFGQSRNFCVDLVPKLLMANGKLVKMLIQTGVTRYMDFNGIAGSYVYNSGRIYKLPVTPTEALTSSLVRMFQKPKLRSFAEFVSKYQAPNRIADTLTLDQFKQAIVEYYKVHNPAKASNPNEIVDVVMKFEPDRREHLVGMMEDKYVFPLFPKEKSVLFQSGPLGMVIEGVSLVVNDVEAPIVKSVVRVKEFVKNPDGTVGQSESSHKIRVNDIISKIGSKSVIGLPEPEVKNLIVNSPRPVEITFMSPNQPLLNIIKYKTKSGKHDLQLKNMSAKQLMEHFGLDDDTQNFLGHGMALETSDDYLSGEAEKFVLSCQLYAYSMGRYGQDSPYLYPLYGLSGIPEGFSRLASIYGGTVMLRTDVDQIVTDESGKAIGVIANGMAARAEHFIGDASFFPPEKSVVNGKVIRSIVISKVKPKHTHGDSAQIIIPAKHIPNKRNDVYVSMISASHQVSPKDAFVMIASTTIETEDPVSELLVAFDVMGLPSLNKDDYERFDFISEIHGPSQSVVKDNCYITASLDATSHFESAAKDIMRIYRQLFGVEVDLDQKLVQSPEE